MGFELSVGTLNTAFLRPGSARELSCRMNEADSQQKARYRPRGTADREHSARRKALGRPRNPSRAGSWVGSFWSGRGVSVKRAYDGAGDEGGAGPGASYERVTMAVPAGGAGPGGSRARATPRCMRICSTTAGSGQDAARMTPAEQDLSLRGTVSQGEVSCGLVLKSSGRNIDNGDGCSTPL